MHMLIMHMEVQDPWTLHCPDSKVKPTFQWRIRENILEYFTTSHSAKTYFEIFKRSLKSELRYYTYVIN